MTLIQPPPTGYHGLTLSWQGGALSAPPWQNQLLCFRDGLSRCSLMMTIHVSMYIWRFLSLLDQKLPRKLFWSSICEPRVILKSSKWTIFLFLKLHKTCDELVNGFIASANMIFNATRCLARAFHIFTYVPLSDQNEETREIHVKYTWNTHGSNVGIV